VDFIDFNRRKASAEAVKKEGGIRKRSSALGRWSSAAKVISALSAILSHFSGKKNFNCKSAKQVETKS
jgi:hypothetical protein